MLNITDAQHHQYKIMFHQNQLLYRDSGESRSMRYMLKMKAIAFRYNLKDRVIGML